MALPVAEAMVKVAEEKQRSYAHKAVAALPLAAAQAIGDIPKGAIERGTEQAAMGKKPRLKDALRLGKAKSISRLGVGAVTTPMFLSGIEDLQSKDKKKKREGAAKVVGAGTAFSATKGGLEAAIDKGIRSPQVGKAVKGAFGARMVTGAAGGLLTAKAIAKSLDRKPKSESQRKKDAVKPYAVGGAIGLAEGAGESALAKGLRSKGARRAAMSKGLGRAAGGVVGTALLKEIAKAGTRKKGMEKKAAEQMGDSYGAYLAAYEWAGSQPTHVAAKKAMTLSSEARMGPMRRATYRGIVDGAQGAPPVAPQRPGIADVAVLGMVLGAPHLALEALEGLPVDKRDILLREGIDRLAVSKAVSLHLGEKGSEAALPGQMFLAPDSPAGVAAHELGHATAGRVRQATIGSQTALKAHRAAALTSTLLPLAVFLSTTEKDFATPEDVEARAAWLESMGKISALVASPKLAEEAMASYKAAQYLQRVGGDVAGAGRKVLMHSLARQIPAFATYAAPLALPFVAAGQLRAKAREARERSR